MTTPHRHIVVPVTDEESSLAAVPVACDLARRERATVELVHVIVVPRALAIDADVDIASRRGEIVLRRAETLAGENVSVRGELLQARSAAGAVVDEVRASNADLVVMGVSQRKRIGGGQLGETSSAILREARCEVWLIRAAVRE